MSSYTTATTRELLGTFIGSRLHLAEFKHTSTFTHLRSIPFVEFRSVEFKHPHFIPTDGIQTHHLKSKHTQPMDFRVTV